MQSLLWARPLGTITTSSWAATPYTRALLHFARARFGFRQSERAWLERFPLGLNRDSQAGRKGGVLAYDSVSGKRHDQALFGRFAGACG
jgi:hypothetical protein